MVKLGGLRALRVAGGRPPLLSVVLLHGYAMTPSDLAPFARSLGVPADFFFPEGPLAATPAGRAWWPIDAEARALAVARGGRDLALLHPDELPAARALLAGLLAEVRGAGLPIVLGGFSQGGMLALDTALHGGAPLAGLALLSSSRIAADEWAGLLPALAGVPALVSHGHDDPDLAFAAGEALRDLLVAAGANVTWAPFEGGHEIPLPVWRALRKFLLARPPA